MLQEIFESLREISVQARDDRVNAGMANRLNGVQRIGGGSLSFGKPWEYRVKNVLIDDLHSQWENVVNKLSFHDIRKGSLSRGYCDESVALAATSAMTN